MAQRQKFTLSEIIREARNRKYRTAKDFWAENESAIKTSYTHYAAVETGTKLPDIELAISIAKILKIDLRLVCHVWAKDQMPSAETKAFFEPIPGREVQGIPGTIQMNLDDFFVMTERHVPMLKKFPQLWSVLSFILAFTDSNPPSVEQLASVFAIKRDEIDEMMEWARNEGLVVSEGGKLKTRRRFFHLPNTAEFRDIRDSNFLLAANDLVKKITNDDLKNKEAGRITYMRRITRVQAQEISRHIDDLVGHFGNLPDAGQEFYALTVGFGSRAKFVGDSV